MVFQIRVQFSSQFKIGLWIMFRCARVGHSYNFLILTKIIILLFLRYYSCKDYWTENPLIMCYKYHPWPSSKQHINTIFYFSREVIKRKNLNIKKKLFFCFTILLFSMNIHIIILVWWNSIKYLWQSYVWFCPYDRSTILYRFFLLVFL